MCARYCTCTCSTRGTRLTSDAGDAGAAHISGFHAQPNAAAAAGTGVGGTVRGTRPLPAAQALAAHRGLTRAHTRNKLLARARLRVDAPGDGEDRAHA